MHHKEYLDICMQLNTWIREKKKRKIESLFGKIGKFASPLNIRRIELLQYFRHVQTIRIFGILNLFKQIFHVLEKKALNIMKQKKNSGK